MSKILKEYGYQFGIVNKIDSEQIIVTLSDPMQGPTRYVFPRMFVHSRLDLRHEDEIVLYMVERNSSPEPQIAKMRLTPEDPKVEQRIRQRVDRELEMLARKYGEK